MNIIEALVDEIYLRSNDWIPYAKREKIKHKEVSVVKWESERSIHGGMIVYPVFRDQMSYTKYELTKKPEMTMTLEWEE